MGNGEKWGKTILKKYGSMEAYNEAVKKIQIEKYGSEEAYRQEMSRRQKKSRENYSGNGGFRSLTPEQRTEISRKGGKAGGRGRKEAN